MIFVIILKKNSVSLLQCEGTVLIDALSCTKKTPLDDYEPCNLQMVFSKYTFLNC